MATNTDTGTDRLARIRRYRRAMYASVVGGTLAFVAASELGYDLLGLAAYWVGIVGFLAVWRGTDVDLYDERDKTIERRASLLSLLAVGVVAVVGVSVVVVLEATSGFELPVLLQGALFGYAATMGVFGVTCYWLRCQR